MFDMMCCIFVDSHGNALYTDLLLIHSTFILAVIASNNFITGFTFSRKQCMSRALLFFTYSTILLFSKLLFHFNPNCRTELSTDVLSIKCKITDAEDLPADLT